MASKTLQDKKVFDFVGKFKIFISISLAVILIGIIMNIIFGVNLSITFKGGSTITYSYTGDIDTDAVAKTVKEKAELDVTATTSENYTTGIKNIVLTVTGDEAISTETQTAVTTALQEVYPDNTLTMTGVTSVAPTIGTSFFLKSLYALLLASVLVIIYVGIRFRNIGGVVAALTALAALVHDAAIVYFTDVILRIPLDLNFIAVVLTILGYSLNDTIVIYDRVRENSKIYGSSITNTELINLSITQSFKRSLITSISTFIAIMSIAIVAAVAGLNSILSFAIPMAVGTVAGSFSSICIAGPLYVKWLDFKDKHNIGKNKSKKKKK
ncbi:MAG: protein translocase subunit SecF [Acutalibacteraceae bacterium]|nr:protein translocase subunit SecF [Acutalibacteraceae bacterium]